MRETHSLKIFSSAFDNEHRLFTRFSHHLATGRAGYGNTAKDWYGAIAISSGVAVVNTSIAVLAAVGVLTGMASLGIALGVTLIGVGAGIAFNIYRNYTKQQRYRHVAHFLDKKQVTESMQDVKVTIMNHFSDYLNQCSMREAREFARDVHHVIAEAIIQKKITHIHELASPKYIAIFQQRIIDKTIQTREVPGVVARLKTSIIDLWKGKKAQEQQNYRHSQIGMFAPAKPELSEPRPTGATQVSRLTSGSG